MATLTFILEDGQEIEVPLPEAITVGSKADNDVVVEDRRMSGHHARVERRDMGYIVRDLKSRVGTYVNGSRVQEKVLTHGDRLKFGPLTGIFVVEELLREPAPTPQKDEARSDRISEDLLPRPSVEAEAPVAPAAQVQEPFLSAPELPPWEEPRSTKSENQRPVAEQRAPSPAREDLFASEEAETVTEEAPMFHSSPAPLPTLTPSVQSVASAHEPEPVSPAEPRTQALAEMQLEGQRINEAALAAIAAGRAEMREAEVLRRVKEAEGRLGQIHAEIAELIRKQQQEEAKLQALQDEAVGTEAACLEHQAAARNAREIANRELADLDAKRLAAAQAESMRLEADAETVALREEKEAHVRELADHKSWLENIRNEIARMASEFADKETVLQTRNELVHQVEEALDRVQAQRESADAELQGVNAAVEAAHQQIIALRTESAEQEEKLRELEARLQAGEAELEAKRATMAQFAQDEDKLLHITADVADAETKREEALARIQTLETEREAKVAALERLHTEAVTAEKSLFALETQRKEVSATIESMMLEHDRVALQLHTVTDAYRKTDAQAREAELLADVRGDQVTYAEKRLQILEQQRGVLVANIAELKGTEERLKKAQADGEAAEARCAELQTTIDNLIHEQGNRENVLAMLEGRVADMIAEYEVREADLVSAWDALRVQDTDWEESRERADGEHTALRILKQSLEGEVGALHETIENGKLELAETLARRGEIALQCEQLSGTEAKLAESQARLQELEAAVEEWSGKHEALLGEHATAQEFLAELRGQKEIEESIQEILHQSCENLRKELTELSERERADRRRFEEIRGLMIEAEKEHEFQKEQHRSEQDAARLAMVELESRLTPLRAWNEDMNQRYEQLASMTEDSNEARDLWQETETRRKAFERVLAGDITVANLEGPPCTLFSPAKGLLYAPEGLSEGKTFEERGNVGPTGTGAMYSLVGQEMALKARIGRLKETAQREAMRVEFLRQSRVREEERQEQQAASADHVTTTSQPEPPHVDAELEWKLKQDEERYERLQTELRAAEKEEEERREAIAELDRRLADLQAAVEEAQRTEKEAAKTRAAAALVESMPPVLPLAFKEVPIELPPVVVESAAPEVIAAEVAAVEKVPVTEPQKMEVAPEPPKAEPCVEKTAFKKQSVLAAIIAGTGVLPKYKEKVAANARK